MAFNVWWFWLTGDIEKSPGKGYGIGKTLSLLEGTFGVWIYNQKNAHIYIARSGSTVYADFLNNEFSSLKEQNFVPLEEGLLYFLTPEGITSVGKFKTNSPFF